MDFISKAKTVLKDHTCVLWDGETVYASKKTGISPMLDLLNEKTELTGFSAADKIVGKAAALLFVLSGVKEVYGEVMSEAGAEILRLHGICFAYGTLVPYIINRQGTGVCPMEQTVSQIDDPKTAYKALLQKREELLKRT